MRDFAVVKCNVGRQKFSTVSFHDCLIIIRIWAWWIRFASFILLIKTLIFFLVAAIGWARWETNLISLTFNYIFTMVCTFKFCTDFKYTIFIIVKLDFKVSSAMIPVHLTPSGLQIY
jgi:hypothetical protein